MNCLNSLAAHFWILETRPHVRLIYCNLEGMTIDGILATDLIAAYRKQKK